MNHKIALLPTVILVAATVGLIGPVSKVDAATITVSTLADGGPGSLRQALSDAADGDSIFIGVTGTTTLASGPLVIATDVSIVGPGALNFVISGGGASRVFTVNAGSIASISQLTISNGFDQVGGAGIRNEGNLTLSGVTVANNTKGGIMNSLDSAGAVLNVSFSTISGNSGPTVGGGIVNWSSGIVTVSNSTISGNSNSADCGGGVYNNGPGSSLAAGNLVVTNSTISGNSATTGGGICNKGIASLTNTTVSGNTTPSGAGGILNLFPGDLTLTHATLTANSGSVGGISAPSDINGNPTNNMRSTIIAGNTGSVPDCAFTTDFVSQGHNLLGNNAGCAFTSATGDLVGTSASPIDPLLGPLQDNGGPTKTHALLPGSPAIDAADNASCPSLDQRGYLRPGGPGCDIGVFEFSSVPVPGLTGLGTTVLAALLAWLVFVATRKKGRQPLGSKS